MKARFRVALAGVVLLGFGGGLVGCSAAPNGESGRLPDATTTSETVSATSAPGGAGGSTTDSGGTPAPDGPSAASVSPTPPPDYIKEAHWEDTFEGPTLFVTPTAAAREAVGSYTAGVEGWAQLEARYPDPRLTEGRERLRDQYICHQQFATFAEPDKPSWELELNRPDVGYLATVKALCNPED